MSAAWMSAPGLTMSAVDTEDYSIYANMSEDQLLQLAIERSLADANRSSQQNTQIRTHVLRDQCSTVQRPPNVPPAATHRATPQPTPNPSANPPSKSQCTKINRDAQNHCFSSDKNKVIAWTRYNGQLQITVESTQNLDPFISAIWQGDAKALTQILKSNPRDLGQANQDGWIPLHEAAYYGHIECLQILLCAEPDTINRRTLKNQTPLLFAVSRKHMACVHYLLDNGANPDLANNQGETPLYKACEKGSEEAVGLLIRYGATTAKSSVQGGTPLHEAVQIKNVTMCKMLLQAGAELWAKNVYGIDALFTAAQCGSAEVLSFLLMKGGDINTQANDGATALFEACKNGHEEVVEVLLSRRADVNKSNIARLLPIHVAAKNGHERIVTMLIPKTSRVNIKHCGISPLHFAAERNRDDVLETLIDAGFDVNDLLSDDWSKMFEDHRSTVLYFAVANSNIEGATMLLEAGANPNMDTFNPLLVAVRKGCMEMVTLLAKHGANVNAVLPTHPTSFPAALMFCTNYLPLFKHLMDSGCDALSCFKCDYGSNSHPPIKPRTNDRENINNMSNEGSESCEQFCEMISHQSASYWAGPVIDILLEYVGQVKLCSRLIEHLDSYSDWALVKEKALLPRTLMHLCRVTICQRLGLQRLRQISALPLPGRLIKYLRHERESFKDILKR